MMPPYEVQGEIPRTTYMRTSEDLARRPLADFLCYDRRGKINGEIIRRSLEAAQRGGNVDFEGRKVRVVSISGRTGIPTPYSARLDLGAPGDESFTTFREL